MILSKKHLLEIFLVKLQYNLKSEASKTYLGYIWWILEPALHVAVLYLVFGTFLARRGEGFVLFLVCGQIPFLWFSRTVQNSGNSILAGRGLINQVQVPKSLFPLLTVFQDLVKQFFVFFLMLMFLAQFGAGPGLTWFLVIFVILTQLLLVVAMSLLVAAIIPFLPDFRFIVASGMTLLLFASGIFYSYKDVILEQHQSLFLMNPMANLIRNYRLVLLENSPPDWFDLSIISLLSAVLIFVMLRFYRMADTRYAMAVAQ